MEHACVDSGVISLIRRLCCREIGGHELQKTDATAPADKCSARLIVHQKPETLVIIRLITTSSPMRDAQKRPASTATSMLGYPGTGDGCSARIWTWLKKFFEVASPKKTEVDPLDATWKRPLRPSLTSTRALSSPYITCASPVSQAKSSSWRRASTTTTDEPRGGPRRPGRCPLGPAHRGIIASGDSAPPPLTRFTQRLHAKGAIFDKTVMEAWKSRTRPS